MKIKLALLAALAFAMPAVAQESEPVKYDKEVMGGYIHTDTEGTDNLNGLRVEFRRHLNEYFAFGVAVDSSYTDVKNGGVNGDIYLTSAEFGGLVKLPIDTWYLYAKGGVSYNYIDISGSAGGYEASESDGDMTYYYGFGMNVPFGDRWFADASIGFKKPEFDFGHGVKGEAQFDTVAIQVGYRF